MLMVPSEWIRSWLPVGEWDKWPVLDFTELGVGIPTVEMRMKYLGY